MTTLDAVLLAALAAFGLRGFFRGFVRETTSLIAVVAATAGVVFYARTRLDLVGFELLVARSAWSRVSRLNCATG